MADQLRKSSKIASENTKKNRNSIFTDEIFVKPFIFDDNPDYDKIKDLNQIITD